MPAGRTGRWIALAGLAAAVGLAFWWQRPASHGQAADAAALSAAPASSAAADGPVPVEVGRAERQRIEEDAQALGTLRARQAVVLRPEVGGRVVQLGFADGQPVRRGQTMVQLDEALVAAQLRQAEAQQSIARTNAQRNRELLAQGFVSQSAVDQTAAALEVASAQVALARAQRERLRIVAPFDGVAGIRAIDVGDYVKEGADLVGLEDRSAIWVDFPLPERAVARVRKGQAVEVSIDALPGRRLAAEVDALDAQLDADGRSLRVRARLAAPDPVLRSGMFARVRIVFSARPDAVLVPEEALVPLGGRQFVVKVTDAPGGGQLAERIEARIGARLPGRVEILEGVAAGDTVVTAGQARLMRDGPQPVKVVDIERPAAPSRPASGARGDPV